MNEPNPTSGWRALRRVVMTLIVVLALLSAVPLAFRLLHDSSNMPLCNKETMMEVINWFDQEERMALPNVDGHSVDSLAKLKENAYEPDKFEQEMNKWNEKYQYVPGLRRGDPGDLVLMYMKHPTRWQNHAAGTPSIFREPKWILELLDFADDWTEHVTRIRQAIPDKSECAERVSLEELKDRLSKTLEFLQMNDRPNWKTVVAENEEFLKSVESQ